MRTAMMVAGLVATMAATMPTLAHAQAAAVREDVVVAAGEGLVRRAPDRAFVTIAAESRHRQPATAQQANARAMTAVLETLARLGLVGDAIRTVSVGVEPEYDWASGRQTLRGYVARNVVDVRIDDIATVGEAVDAVVASGATQVRHVRFTLKDMEGAAREALTLASRDALGRARAMADGVARGVARVVRLDETHDVMPIDRPLRMAAEPMMAEAAAPPTPVAAGEIEIRARVTLTAVLQ